MWTDDYRWHFDYVRLAWDAGFSFEKNKYPNLDKNKICLVDVDRVVKERDVASIERFIPTVAQYILDSDQAEVLDSNFVKMFRMSQLSVEYLLFCKRYLDNTVVLLKKELTKFKEENKELRLFTQELEGHISTLTKQSNLISTFNCQKCSKVFSTEEYLHSHIKRRHNEESKSSTLAETDVLQSEIKELKERLNATEKLLQEKDQKEERLKTESIIDENKMRVEEIQEKFEKFREKVENDLKILQIQKNFYEDKYSKLFDIVMQANKENVTQKSDEKQFVEAVIDKIENTTQTDKESKELQMESVENKNVYNFKEASGSLESIAEKSEVMDETIEQKILKFEENIESKISSSFNNIQNQMEAFWSKLSELEVKREQILVAQQSVCEEVPDNVAKLSVETIKSKPEIKPRTKLSKPNKIIKDSNDNVNADKIKAELDRMYSKTGIKSVSSKKTLPETKSQIKVVERPSTTTHGDSSITSELESETKSDDIIEIMPKKSFGSKRSMSTQILSMRSSVKSKESLGKYRQEIDALLDDRLQEMGISPSWQGIPQKTFERALAIVKHQASLRKKVYPDYDSIKRSIERSLRNNKEFKELKKQRNTSPKVRQPNIINIRYKKVSKETKPMPEPEAQTVQIKNRSLYEDTESDSIQPNRPLSQQSQPLPAYSDVMAELKTVQKQNADTDSDLTSLILLKDDKNEPQTKSALKNYPSMGSLTKKKVLFDIGTDESRAEVEVAPQMGGSTTSVASSVLDGQQVVEKKDKREDSLSDFDLSGY